MKLISCMVNVCLILALSLAAFGEDQKSAEKQVTKISAMATDKTGRRMVSMSMAAGFKTSRADLVKERQTTGLDYGSLFVAHELLANDFTMADVATGLSGGKDIWQIGADRHANWKQIAGDAKKMNTTIDEHIYRHFVSEKKTKADDAQDAQDGYDTFSDVVPSDSHVAKGDIAEAQERYVFWRDRAAQESDKHLSVADQNAARIDHARNGPSGSANGSMTTGAQAPGISPQGLAPQ